MTKTQSPQAQEERTGLSVQQWMLLAFSFLLGIAAVLTVDKVLLSNDHPAGAAHAAAVSNP